MSAIIASTYVADAQADGRLQVHEVHTDLIGLEHTRDWLADADADIPAALGVHADLIGDALHDDEVAANVRQVLGVGAGAQLSFLYCTADESIAAFRAAFATAEPGQALMTVDYLLAQPDNALQTIFALTADQVTALRALPTPAAQLAAVAQIVEAAGG